MNYYDNNSELVNWNPSYTPTYTYSLRPKENMEVYHTADEFTIVRQANKMGGITVGYTYFKITKIPADEANFYKDSASDKS